jgi:hypothetical protein
MWGWDSHLQQPGFAGKSVETSNLAVPLEVHASKPTFEAKLTFLMSILLLYPFCLLCLIYAKPEMRYWFGHWSIATAAGVFLWIFFTHCSLKFGTIRRGLAAIFAVVIPSAALVGICQVQAWQLEAAAATLVSSDCDSFAKKATVQRAWQVAEDLRNSCKSSLESSRGLEPDEGFDLHTCPGYSSLESTFGLQWSFLEELEQKYHCGGWCSAATTQWVSSPSHALDSCSLAFGRAIGGNIKILSMQITIYSFVLLGSASLLLLFSPTSMAAA